MPKEKPEQYIGFAYAGWQEGLPASSGFNLYTCLRCGTTIAEQSIKGHVTEICESILHTKGSESLELKLNK